MQRNTRAATRHASLFGCRLAWYLNEMKSELMALGVNDQQAQSVADQVGVVQKAVTARQRRWYERL